ncbi:hypothetical protein D3C73_946050 [compost metagenome]
MHGALDHDIEHEADGNRTPGEQHNLQEAEIIGGNEGGDCQQQGSNELGSPHHSLGHWIINRVGHIPEQIIIDHC